MKSSKTPPLKSRAQHWLLKSEPDVFSFADLQAKPNATASWDGVRNYQARNNLRAMRLGDLAFFYHSSTNPSCIVGVCEIVREAHPDPSQFDPHSPYADPKSPLDAPRWVQVDVQAREPLRLPLTLANLRTHKTLTKMVLLQRGSRLSVQPVTAKEFAFILGLGA